MNSNNSKILVEKLIELNKALESLISKTMKSVNKADEEVRISRSFIGHVPQEFTPANIENRANKFLN